jgi:protein SCO1/2
MNKSPLRSCFFAALLLPIGVAGQTVPSNVGAPSASLASTLLSVGFDPQLNAQMPLDLTFHDETGSNIRLGEYFGQKPVLLAFVYYDCPMLCSQVEQGMVSSLKAISFNPGKNYEVIFISFDPRDTPQVAARKKASAMSRYARSGTETGWHFLTGSETAIRAATQAANFRYAFDQKTGLFAHASGILVLTPIGRISRYFYGIDYPNRDLRLGLVDASSGKIGSSIDRVLLLCYQYDPTTARYGTTVLRLLRLAGVLTVAALVLGILIFRRRDPTIRPTGLSLLGSSVSPTKGGN